MTAVRICDPDTPEWLQARQTGIGASEAAAVCGLSEYATPLDIYLRKRGEIDPPEETDAMRLGHLLEPVIASEFTRRTGITPIRSPAGLYRREDEPWMLATPDAELPENEGGEWKSTTGRLSDRYGDDETDDLPTPFTLQAQWQMGVCGFKAVRFGVLFDGRSLKTFTVARNETIIAGLVERGRELWERIQNGDPPEPNWETRNTRAMLAELFPGVREGTRIELSTDAVEAWEKVRTLKAEIREREKLVEKLRASVLYEIGEHYGGVLPGGRMIRRKLIAKEPFLVEPKPYVDVREVKFDGGLIVSTPTVTHTVIRTRQFECERLLAAAGYKLRDVSESGSRYYRADDERPDVRVSDHEPNTATAEWMERNSVIGVRIDRPEWSVAELEQQVSQEVGA